MFSIRRYRVPYLILTASLLFTAAVTYYLHVSTATQDRLRFDGLIQRVETTIQERVNTCIALLRATAALFAVHEPVSRQAFHQYITQLEIRERYPGIQGIGYSLRIPSDQLRMVEQEIRATGMPDFRVWPTEPRKEYYSIIYLEPLDRRNRAALGYDMFTENVRRAAMARARDNGRPSASGKVTLIQEIDPEKQAGFLIYYPLYQGGGVPATLDERRKKLRGFVYSPFRTDDLLRLILRPEYESGIVFSVYDAFNPRTESLLHQSANENRFSPKEATFRKTKVIRVAERPWTLEFYTTPQFQSGSAHSWVPTVVTAGLLMSIILFFVSRAQVNARMQAEKTTEELRRSEEALRRTEHRARALVGSNVIGVIVADFQGNILDANDTFLNILGYTREDLKNGAINWQKLTPPEFASLDEQAMRELTKSGTHVPFEKEYVRKDGKRVPVLVGTSYLGEGVGIAFVLDMSAAKTAEAALRESHNLLQAIIDGTNDAIFVKDVTGKYIMMNSACASLFNRSVAELIGKDDQELFGEEIGRRLQEGDRRVLTSGESQRFEDILRTASGELRTFQADKGFYRDVSGNLLGVVGIARDITDLKLIENRLREQTETLETVNRIGRLLSGELDRNKLIQAVTDATTVLANAEMGAFFIRSDNQGQSHFKLQTISGEGSDLFAEIETASSSPFFEYIFGGEAPVRINDIVSEYQGPQIPELSRQLRSLLAVPVISLSAEKVGGLLLGHQSPGKFTEREESVVVTVAAQAAIAIDNAQLFEASQRERTKVEVLFKEVHHRVKNNMQIILSLLRLQSSYLMDPKSVEILADSRNRIKTMALIHEKLYQSDDLEKVDFNKYIEALTGELIRTYAVSSTKVDLQLDCSDCYLNINTAVPLGLIVNELTSNALKYAFGNGDAGKIGIQLRKEQDTQYRLTFADNGVGLPKQIDVANSSTLGLRLVSMLVSQLQGSVEVDRSGGTTFRIRFLEQM